MNLYLEILESPDLSLVGAKVRLYAGFTLGRKDVDFVIRDKKLSACHARVEVNADGRFVLIDLDSSNGVFINDRKVRQVVLLNNVHFTIGKTTLKVLEALSDQSVEGLRFANWSDELRGHLRLFLEKQNESVAEGTNAASAVQSFKGVYSAVISPFFEAVQLTFTAGLQVDEEFILGYGPRRGGFYHFDIALLEPQCPEELFELRPVEAGVELVCFDSDFLKLNGQSVSKHLLQNGDRLDFGRSQIHVSLLGRT